MAEVMGDSFVAGNEDSSWDTLKDPDPLNNFFDYDSFDYESFDYESFDYDSFDYESFDYNSFDYESFDYDSFDYESFDYESFDYESFDYDSFVFDSAAADTCINIQPLIDYPVARPIHQNPDPTEEVFSFESLSERNDSAGSETPDVHRSEPLPTGPSAPNLLILPEHITLAEPIASTDNRLDSGFSCFEIWVPSRELNGVDVEKDYSKTTKQHKLPSKAPRKKAAIDDANRKRARRGTTCVRCKLQKLKCSGGNRGIPCEKCVGKVWWKDICVRAKLQERCFLKGVYRTRLNVMLDNVKYFIPANQEPLVEIRVGIGYKASLLVKVNKFIPIDQTLLEQASFRKNADVESPPTPWRAGPYGLKDSKISHTDLDMFLDEMVQELVENESHMKRDLIWVRAVTAAHQRSLYVTRRDSRILRNVLRMWAAQTSYAMDHMWRVSDGADKIGSEFHPGLGASVTPRTLMWQLDAVMEGYLQALEEEILEDFDRLVFPPGHRMQSTWLSTFLATYIYLACLETDAWIIRSWEVKTARWKLDPLLASNRTMQWPLNVDPSLFVDKNAYQAQVVIGHMRALTQGRLPFSKAASGNSIGVKPNITSPDEDTRAFAESFQNDFIDLAEKLKLREGEPYREHDQHSFEYLFLAKLLIDP